MNSPSSEINNGPDDDLLQTLTRQAQAKQEADEQAAAEAEAERQRRAKAVEERVVALEKYFRKLKESLEVLAPDLDGEYEIPQVGPLNGLKQGSYHLFSDDQKQGPPEFTFHYCYMSDQPAIARIADRGAAQQLKETLWALKLEFSAKEQGDGKTLFSIASKVTVSFKFTATPDGDQIKLTIRNLNRFGSTTNHLALEEANRELADEIAKCVLHKPNRLDELTGDNLTQTGLFRIRDQLKRHQEEMGAPTEPEPAAVAEPEAAPDEDRSLRNKAWKILTRKR